MLTRSTAIGYDAVYDLPESLTCQLVLGDGLLRGLSVRYLETLVRVAADNWALTQVEIDALRQLGADAARQGVSVGELVKVCTSGARALWPRLSYMAEVKMGHVLNRSHVMDMAADVLRVADAALSAVTAGHAEARRLAVAGDHSAREEFLTDLFSGRADVASLVERAERIGLQLAVPHFTVVVGIDPGFESVARSIEAALHSCAGGSRALVLDRHLQLVAVIPAVSSTPAVVKASLGRVYSQPCAGPVPGWRVGIGRVRTGLRGIQVSHQDAREAVELATRLGATEHIVSLDQLLLYRALTRDRGAIADLIKAVLDPLTRSRHGAQPLLETLHAYFAAGCVTTHTAQLLHLSVRAVSYRFARIQQLTGYDVDMPTDRLALHMAVMGARMLGWPTEPLPESD
jgi:hypothetical protein